MLLLIFFLFLLSCSDNNRSHIQKSTAIKHTPHEAIDSAKNGISRKSPKIILLKKLMNEIPALRSSINIVFSKFPDLCGREVIVKFKILSNGGNGKAVGFKIAYWSPLNDCSTSILINENAYKEKKLKKVLSDWIEKSIIGDTINHDDKNAEVIEVEMPFLLYRM